MIESRRPTLECGVDIGLSFPGSHSSPWTGNGDSLVPAGADVGALAGRVGNRLTLQLSPSGVAGASPRGVTFATT